MQQTHRVRLLTSVAVTSASCLGILLLLQNGSFVETRAQVTDGQLLARVERPCTQDMCGRGPKLGNYLCQDGRTGGPVCTREAAGCVWSIVQCTKKNVPQTTPQASASTPTIVAWTSFSRQSVRAGDTLTMTVTLKNADKSAGGRKVHAYLPVPNGSLARAGIEGTGCISKINVCVPVIPAATVDAKGVFRPGTSQIRVTYTVKTCPASVEAMMIDVTGLPAVPALTVEGTSIPCRK
jgi:hypothetical protein